VPAASADSPLSPPLRASCCIAANRRWGPKPVVAWTIRSPRRRGPAAAAKAIAIAAAREGMLAVLRDDAFKPKLAGMREYGRPIAFEVRAELDSERRLAKQLLQLGPALLKRSGPPVLAIEFE
jgi:hypothetical protein